ncbi:unnamed protein product [Mycena citricolor]|uniref:Ubiquitin carboxyl-terminal hydrolase n=1 Tax=Mycena citricolor TaxID=2018698 RepID=A0AAD2HC75_9AGAR|nr:unnamed protein product [Mycena citricolor]CAK5272808.1 unnamed protein product [Mycena citricolor]
MAKPKAPTPQELYRARKQREEQEKLAYLPPGLINHGNTCFMNSVLQGLLATRLLSQLVHFAPIPAPVQAHAATLLASRRSPQLTNGHDLGGEFEKEWVDTMPIGDMFLNVMHRAWDAEFHRRRENLSPKPLLAALGKKYDQYLDFAQQDAHEFLRILLDAMSMEELDAIKKTNPPPPPKTKKPRRAADSSSPPDAPIALADMIFGGKLTSILVCQKCKHVSHTYEDFNDLSLSIKQEDYERGQRKRDRFKSFAKRLGVSIGHEPRSSSVPPPPSPRIGVTEADSLVSAEEPRRRSLDFAEDDAKTDSDGSGPEASPPIRINGVSLVVTSDEKHIEFVDQPKAEHKEKKKDDDGWAKLGRRLSLGLAKKDRERSGRLGHRKSRDFSAPTTPRASTTEFAPEIRVSSPRPQSPPNGIAAPTPLRGAQAAPVERSKSPKPPKPTAGETAYLRRILADVAAQGADALWLKFGGGLPGVEECLRMFTSVEVLDGENQVGCRRCWKIANGVYVPPHRDPEEDRDVGAEEDSEDSAADDEVDALNPIPHVARRLSISASKSAPHISVYTNLEKIETTIESASSLPLAQTTLSEFDIDAETSVTSVTSSSSTHSLPLADTDTSTPPATVNVLPPTPVETTDPEPKPFVVLDSISEVEETRAPPPPPAAAAPDANGLHPHYGRSRHLSDADSTDGSSDDESDASAASEQAPAKPKTKKPKPVIMRPAYKRYLIAVPPPVLVIHLKRFQQVSKTMMTMSFSHGFKKLDDYVTFPEQLDLSPFLAPKKEDYGLKKGAGWGRPPKTDGDRCMYRLYAVVVHIGNMLGGHYISYVALPTAKDVATTPNSPVGQPAPGLPTNGEAVKDEPRQWAYISDTIVRLTSLEEVLKAKAYICLYERV